MSDRLSESFCGVTGARILMLTTFEGDLEIQRALVAGLATTC